MAATPHEYDRGVLGRAILLVGAAAAGVSCDLAAAVPLACRAADDCADGDVCSAEFVCVHDDGSVGEGEGSVAEGEGEGEGAIAGQRFRVQLDVDNATAEELDDFPLLVTLTNTRVDYAHMQPLGQDVRFFD